MCDKPCIVYAYKLEFVPCRARKSTGLQCWMHKRWLGLFPSLIISIMIPRHGLPSMRCVFIYERNSRGLDGNVDGNLACCEIVCGKARNALDGKADGNFNYKTYYHASARRDYMHVSVVSYQRRRKSCTTMEMWIVNFFISRDLSIGQARKINS